MKSCLTYPLCSNLIKIIIPLCSRKYPSVTIVLLHCMLFTRVRNVLFANALKIKHFYNVI